MALMISLMSALPAGAQLTITDAIPGTFVDIADTGTPLGLADDGVAEVWPDFDLSVTIFTGGRGSAWISNNGAMGFLYDGSSGAYYLNSPIPSFALFGGTHSTPQALAPYWDDLAAETGDVYYATLGEPGEQVFIVQWHNRPHYPGDPALDGNEATFQVQIFENASPGHAQFLYLDVDFQNPEWDDGASATIGYQAGGLFNDVQWSFDTPGAVTAGMVLTLADATPACPHKGDGNGDCYIDTADLAEFTSYMLGPNTPAGPEAECYDFDEDGDVDGADFAQFQIAFTGPDDPIPGCTP
jgi:hypothetical protein